MDRSNSTQLTVTRNHMLRQARLWMHRKSATCNTYSMRSMLAPAPEKSPRIHADRSSGVRSKGARTKTACSGIESGSPLLISPHIRDGAMLSSAGGWPTCNVPGGAAPNRSVQETQVTSVVNDAV
jgi:hypothetical protein